MDPGSYLNPKVTNDERERQAGLAAAKAASTPTTNYSSKFSKPFTDAERAKQAAALVTRLRKDD